MFSPSHQCPAEIENLFNNNKNSKRRGYNLETLHGYRLSQEKQIGIKSLLF